MNKEKSQSDACKVESTEKIGVAVLGYGTIGSGVVEVFETNRAGICQKAGRSIEIKKVLDLREFPGNPIQDRITHNIEDILQDDGIQIVVEVMGGTDPAYTYVREALLSGRSVVTSNKELVARHGAELLETARNQQVNFLFEASVGGGIPIIRPLNKSLTSDEIDEISGILNGTTNFILTKMARENREYGEVLAEAQALGFAERNPEADVEGHDACRKLAILLSLALGRQVSYEEIHTEGMTGVTPRDFQYAALAGGAVKLVAAARIRDDMVSARVSPVVVDQESPLFMVSGVNNGIVIKGKMLGEVMFYGQGAGKLPTACAVMSDVIECAKHLKINIMHHWSSEKVRMQPVEEEEVRMLIRVGCEDRSVGLAAAGNLFGVSDTAWCAAQKKGCMFLDGVTDEFAFITDRMPEKDIREKIRQMEQAFPQASVRGTMRMYPQHV